MAITENNKSGRERSCQRICDLKDPVIDEITETQAIRLGFGRRWLAHQCATGALTWKRAGVHRNSPKVYSLKKLKELKDGIDPLLKSLI